MSRHFPLPHLLTSSTVRKLCCLLCSIYIFHNVQAEDEVPRTFTIPGMPFELKPGETLSSSKNWGSLDDSSPVVALKENKQIILTLKNNARFRSTDVAAYPPPPTAMALSAQWLISSQVGAMGFGWIDFSSSQYYYLYEDAERQELILQRGDGISTKQLALHSLPRSTIPRTFSLSRTELGKGRIQLSIQVDGKDMGDPVTDQPEKATGSTFQIYVGSGNNAEVSLLSISTIPAVERRKASGWFW